MLPIKLLLQTFQQLDLKMTGVSNLIRAVLPNIDAKGRSKPCGGKTFL